MGADPANQARPQTAEDGQEGAKEDGNEEGKAEDGEGGEGEEKGLNDSSLN